MLAEGVAYTVENYACGDRDVERMLGAILRNFDASVAEVNHFLLNAKHLVAEDDRQFTMG